jgi:hypothetical protein
LLTVGDELRLNPDVGLDFQWLSFNPAFSISKDNEFIIIKGLSMGTGSFDVWNDYNSTAFTVRVVPVSLEIHMGETADLVFGLHCGLRGDVHHKIINGNSIDFNGTTMQYLRVRGLQPGTTVVQLAFGRYTLDIPVTVHPSNALIIDGRPKGNTMHIGESAQLSIRPAGQNVVWQSSNPAVATVSGSGLLTAGARGTAVITATTTCGAKSAVFDLTVYAPAAFIQTTVSHGQPPSEPAVYIYGYHHIRAAAEESYQQRKHREQE